MMPKESLQEVSRMRQELFIGIPKEISFQEHRIPLVPEAVAVLVNHGHRVLIETGAGVLVITHYARILRYLKKLDYVHVVAKGKVIKSGGKELSEELEAKGYGWLGLEDK